MGFEISVGEKFASWVFSRCDLRLPKGRKGIFLLLDGKAAVKRPDDL